MFGTNIQVFAVCQNVKDDIDVVACVVEMTTDKPFDSHTYSI